MNTARKPIRLVCLLTLMLALLGLAGTTYARYRVNLRETLTFEAAQNDASHALEIRSEEGWVATSDGMSLTFTLSNVGDVTGQKAYLRLTATEGLDPEKALVTLTAGETTHVGVPQPIAVGNALYAAMGAGTEYRFATDGGESLWEVSPTAVYTLTVEGETDVSLLRLTATAV